jgi:hypothetical protein
MLTTLLVYGGRRSRKCWAVGRAPFTSVVPALRQKPPNWSRAGGARGAEPPVFEGNAMSTLSPGTAAASWPPSMRTSVAVSTGAAALAGVLAAGVVWASQLWWLPWGDEGDPGDLSEWDPDGNDDADDWTSDSDEGDDPDGWSLDVDSDRSRWRLTE